VIELGENRYGKAGIRLVKVVREPGGHRVRDLTVAVALEGGFEAAHTAGDNSAVVATDTMKNTVYALAKDHLTGSIEEFGLSLCRHFLAAEQVARVTVTLDEHRWRPLDLPTGPAADAFARAGAPTRTAEVSAEAGSETVEAGLRDLTVMKTSGSAFSGFPRDRYTTLRDTEDRILATKVTATWRYAPLAEDADGGRDYDASWERVVDSILEVFAAHHSPSVQASIWLMAEQVLERHADVEEVRMTLPNLHHWLVDLSPFGLTNENEIFVATSEPYGLIEATVRRGSPAAGSGGLPD
jgi:urate oxidase